MLNAYALRPGGGGIITKQTGRLRPEAQPSLSCIPHFWPGENLPLSYTVLLTNATPFSFLRSFVLTLHLLKRLQHVFLTFFTASICIFQPLWAFFHTEKKIPYPFIYFSYWIPYPFIYLKPKKCPFWAELPRVDHCRKYPRGNLTGLFLMSWLWKCVFCAPGETRRYISYIVQYFVFAD